VLTEGPRADVDRGPNTGSASAQYIAKQNQYQQAWLDLKPSIANLPPDEQDARRAALKKTVLGD
jgi:hypothetical protein